MTRNKDQGKIFIGTFETMTLPAKVLATCIIFAMTVGMVGALGQIIIHDIIPTFFNEKLSPDTPALPHDNEGKHQSKSTPPTERGDLFSDLSATTTEPKHKPFYINEKFVWTLKWTHIHLFGMSMIFIFIGVITLFLNASAQLRAWLIALPFLGVLVDILAMWLKAFVSPIFFWLHVPGGGLFGIIFGYVSIRALWEMWIKPDVIGD